MTGYALFCNNVDVGVNQTIATRTGEGENYKAAVDFFKEKRVQAFQYVVIRKDLPYQSSPSCYTNIWGEIKELGPTPWLFAPEI